MVVFGYLMLILLPAGFIGYILWDHKRKTAEREAESAARLQELMGIATLAQAQPAAKTESVMQRASTVSSASVAAAAPAASPRLAEEDAPPSALYAMRGRILNPPQTLLYYLLKTGLPEHVIFPRVTLASILEAGPALSGFARDEQIRRLAALTVEFVVADKNMRPLAVVELSAPEQPSAAQSDRAAARTRLEAAGVRYLELDAKALPRKDAIRALVLDEADARSTSPESAS